jgi:monovalent cation:H+ antiporter-2, CPA2 family
MPHETPLIATIVMGLVLAYVGGFLASKLRLPTLVGYLLAGIAVGPFTPGFVADAALAGQLAEIGVILLMFGVGLHFSIGDLLEVRWIALPGALGQIAIAVAACVGLATLWDWPAGAGVLLGLALSVASTVVLLRILEERRLLDSDEGRLAVGWLIVQDLVMVLAIVLLPAFAHMSGGTTTAEPDPAAAGGMTAGLALTVGKIAMFIVSVLVVGKRLVPWLLAQTARTGSRELFTLSVLAVALGIAFGSADLFGVSFALGAFFAGVVLSESDFSHQAAADSLPFRDAFAVLFFVSVGMLFDPSILLRQPLNIAAILLVIMLVKSLPAIMVMLAFRLPVEMALTVAAGLAQIGEFSFILAGLGVTFGLLPPEGEDLILAGALLSITLNPLVLAAVGPVAGWIRSRSAMRGRQGQPTTAPAPPGASLRDHAVIVGFGRVGSAIGRALEAWDLPFVAIEQDRRLVERLRARGVPVLSGDASAPGLLAEAGIDRARLLIIASPDGYQARRILELARQVAPKIDTVVRTHSEAEMAYLLSQGVGLVVQGEREIALGMTGYALRSLGLSEGEARMFVQSSRGYDDAGIPSQVPDEGVPELRSRRDQNEEL